MYTYIYIYTYTYIYIYTYTYIYIYIYIYLYVERYTQHLLTYPWPGLSPRLYLRLWDLEVSRQWLGWGAHGLLVGRKPVSGRGSLGFVERGVLHCLSPLPWLGDFCSRSAQGPIRLSYRCVGFRLSNGGSRAECPVDPGHPKFDYLCPPLNRCETYFPCKCNRSREAEPRLSKTCLCG